MYIQVRNKHIATLPNVCGSLSKHKSCLRELVAKATVM